MDSPFQGCYKPSIILGDTMEVDQLSEDAQSKLQVLMQGIADALKASKTLHLRAVSQSAMPEEDVLSGGAINSSEAPPIDYEMKEIMNLHREVHQASAGVLHSLVIHAHRPDPKSPWELSVKLISADEHARLLASRASIDGAVEAELKRLTDVSDWRSVLFGRSSANYPTKLTRVGAAGPEPLEPSKELVELLARAEELYRSAGHELIVAQWALRRGGLDFREYFE
jgi:hypothetical protein